jgi:hypothetical protein
MKSFFWLFLLSAMATVVQAEVLSVIQTTPRGEVADDDLLLSIQVVFNQPVRLMKSLDTGDPAGFISLPVPARYFMK